MQIMIHLSDEKKAESFESVMLTKRLQLWLLEGEFLLKLYVNWTELELKVNVNMMK